MQHSLLGLELALRGRTGDRGSFTCHRERCMSSKPESLTTVQKFTEAISFFFKIQFPRKLVGLQL